MACMKELPNFGASSCVFCKQTKHNDLLYGKICQYGDITTHHYCVLFSSHIEQNGEDEEGILGFLCDDIKKELIRGRKLNCTYCHKDGATINCAYRGCKKRYHLPCAVDKGALLEFFDQFRSFCFQHRRSQVVPKKNLSQQKSICLVCQEDVKCIPSLDTIWAPCCKTAWFHRLCVQRMASSAGYFFKCPNCNNKEEYRREMRNCGIYIPDKDASWELVQNAFQELNERHNQCDAETCKCPNGRTYSATDGKWEIALCLLCGSQGIHVHCGREKIDSKGLWSCEFCISIVSKMKPTVPAPGPSMNTNRPGPRHPRKRAAETTEISPALKAIIVNQTTQNAAKEESSESTKFLYDNGGQAIHVVKLDNIDSVVEIGGVNVVEEGSNVIELESSDDDEEYRSTPPARLFNILSTNHRPSSGHTIRRNPPLSTTEPPSLVIDLLDSDEDCPNTNECNSRLSAAHVDDDDDDDVVFMGCHNPPDEKEQTQAMIRIVEDNNVVIKSAAELRQDATKQVSAVGSTVNVISMWQSVPREKSMVHCPQNLTQATISSGHDRNLNDIIETNQITPGSKEQRWIPKFLPSSGSSSNRSNGPITNNYVSGVNEVINLD